MNKYTKQIFNTIAFLLVLTNTAFAAPHFEFTPLAKRAYSRVISLRFAEAIPLIVDLRLNEPDNLISYYIEDYMDIMKIIIHEDKAEFKKLEPNKSKRLTALERGKSCGSPYYRFCVAEINLHWAIARGKFGEYGQYVTAIREVNTAYQLLTENQKKYPDFIANKKSLGILHAVIGTIPDELRWGAKLLSMNGTIAQGQKEIEEVVEYSNTHPFVFDEETLVMYSFALLYLGNQGEDAWNVIRKGKLDASKNPLAALALANVAMRTGRNDEAIDYLKARPQSSAYAYFALPEYLLGVAKLYKEDKEAKTHFQTFINKFPGKNYIKNCYQKLAWSCLINGDEKGYWDNMALCKTKGTDVIDEDKSAFREASKGLKPDITLLRARLRFDGGYYREAYDIINTKKKTDYGDKRFELEHTYRLGRITQKMRNNTEALQHFQATIDNGKNEPYYFACNAALQMGTIYEEMGNKQQAINYYKICLDISPEEFGMSLHQKAKTGLNRVE
jgi:tetratricopeptide (TPR) repeat protein